MPESRRRVALHKATLTARTVAGARPGAHRYVIWDERLTGFGLRVSPSGTRSFIVQYRTSEGGRRAANRKKVLGRAPVMTPARARSLARELLRRVATQEYGRAVPTLRTAFESYLAARPALAEASRTMYRQVLSHHAHDWLDRGLDTIDRADVERRFLDVSACVGPVAANKLIGLLGAVYRGPCVDHPGLRSPMALWRAGGGKLHSARRRTIAPPAEVLPRWRRGIEAVPVAVVRDMVWFGLFTGLRRSEVSGLRWEHVNPVQGYFRIEETKSGRPLELPITRQAAAILERRREAARARIRPPAEWVFPGPMRRGPFSHVNGWYGYISEMGGAKFWFHACRNCFITVAVRDLMLPDNLVKRLVNHAPSRDVTEGYAADWTLEQLRRAAQRIADRIEGLAREEDPGGRRQDDRRAPRSAKGLPASTRKQVLTLAAVSQAKPQLKPYVIWDARLTGFGVRVSPGGTKSFFIQYRTGEGRRADAKRKVALGRFPMLSPAEARKRGLTLLGTARVGSDRSRERTRTRALPKLGKAVEEWLRTRPRLGNATLVRYRSSIEAMLRGWSTRRLDEVTREDIALRFAEVTHRHGWTQANKGMKVLGAVYRRCVADRPGLHDPVAAWAAAGGRLHRARRRQIEAPAEVLPAWAHGIDQAVRQPEMRDLFRTGLYTGMRLDEVRSLRWEHVDFLERTVRVDRTKTGEPLMLPFTRQLHAVLERRWRARDESEKNAKTSWVFASSRSRSGRAGRVGAVLYRSIERRGGKPFWFHAMRNCFISVASRDLLLPESLVKRLVNHRRPAGDVTQGYAADWTLAQLQGPAQRIADRIDELIAANGDTPWEGDVSVGTGLPGSAVPHALTAAGTNDDVGLEDEAAS